MEGPSEKDHFTLPHQQQPGGDPDGTCTSSQIQI